MTAAEAVRACEFWTTAGPVALGSTSDPEVAAFFGAGEKDSVPRESITNPKGARIFAIRVPAKTQDGPFSIDNLTFKLILQEIERRKQ